MIGTFYCNAYSGYARGRDANWATCRTMTDANEGVSTDSAKLQLHAGWIPWLSRYHISRVHLLFDTSALPVGAVISSAVIHFQKLVADGDTRYTHACASTKSASSNLVNADYSAVGATSFGSVNTTTTGAKEITLDANGIAQITAGGISKFALRIDKDINNSTPTDYDENGEIGGPTNATEAYRPYIVITYTPPPDFQISGTVTLNGAPVEGALVRCVRQSDNEAITAETSDSAGEYTFTNLEEEELYHLCVEFEDETEKYYAKSYWDIAPVEVEL